MAPASVSPVQHWLLQHLFSIAKVTPGGFEEAAALLRNSITGDG